MADMSPWEMNWDNAPISKAPQVQEEVVAPTGATSQAPWEMNWGGQGAVEPTPANTFDKFESKVGQETISRLIHIESSGRADAQAKTSSARGLTQFIDNTWLAMIEKYRPDLSDSLSEGEVLDLRDDPTLSIEMATRLADENIAVLERAGVEPTDGAVYLAHFAGIGTARKLLKGKDDEPASKYFSASAVRANKSILEGKTVGDVKAWAERKMEKAGGKGHVAKFLGG